MTFTKDQIDWIVAEVLRRLAVADATSGNSPAASAASEGELRIADKVVTMRAIETRLCDVKRVVVQRRAVVTPAVRDELKAKKIELIFESK